MVKPARPQKGRAFGVRDMAICLYEQECVRYQNEDRPCNACTWDPRNRFKYGLRVKVHPVFMVMHELTFDNGVVLDQGMKGVNVRFGGRGFFMKIPAEYLLVISSN